MGPEQIRNVTVFGFNFCVFHYSAGMLTLNVYPYEIAGMSRPY